MYARFLFAVIAATFFLRPAAAGETAVAPAVEALLIEGRLDDARKQLDSHLASAPDDDDARAALGVVEALDAVEQLVQSLYRYGLQPTWATALPFVRIPVPPNPAPEPLTNEAFRGIIAEFLADLARVEQILAEVKSDDVKLTLHLGMYRLDFNHDGQASDRESLWQLFSQLTGRAVDERTATNFAVAVDKGDVHWLRGYCRLLSAVCEMFLAYDTSTLHDYTAQAFFPSAKVRFPQILKQRGPGDVDRWQESIFDAIAFIHLLHLPLAEPERVKSARGHLLAVIEQSRASWKAILAEQDDDREWIPNPSQRDTVIPGVQVSQHMIDAWHGLLNELEALLNGEKLIPFWRGDTTMGVNLRRAFEEPTPFDLVLWVQGTAAVPYLEEGELTQGAFWTRMITGFRGQFMSFAIWVN